MSSRFLRGAGALAASVVLAFSLVACSSDSGSTAGGRADSAPHTGAQETRGGSSSAATKAQAGSGNNAKGKKTAALRLDDGTRHVFELKTCILGKDDAVASGASADLPGWLDLDLSNGLTAGEMRIDVGTTDEFTSTDDLIVLQEFDKGRHVAPLGFDILTLEGTVTMPDNSKQGGVLTVECER